MENAISKLHVSETLPVGKDIHHFALLFQSLWNNIFEFCDGFTYIVLCVDIYMCHNEEINTQAILVFQVA
jgi:hypothetical protein